MRLLTLPDFVDATLGKVVRLRQRLTGAADAVEGLFGGAKSGPDPAVLALDALRDRMDRARSLFRCADTTSFVIVSIPTVMAAAESGRLARALQAFVLRANESPSLARAFSTFSVISVPASGTVITENAQLGVLRSAR